MHSLNNVLDCTRYQNALNDLKAELPAVPRRHLPEFFAIATRLSLALPAELREAIAEFRLRGNDEGFLYLRGLPIDEDALPATPESYPAPADRELLDMEAWITLFGMLLGKATGYAENRAGSVFQDVYPAPDAHHMTAHNYDTDLRYHTEMGYHREQPHYLAIACSRADHEHVAKTLVASVRKAVRLLSEEHRHTLRTIPLPWHVDLAFRSEADPDPMTRLLLLSENDDVLRYDRGLIVPSETGEAAEALQAFSAAIDEVAAAVYLKPGDLILVDNFRTAHARTPFRPKFDGTDRWLNRIFLFCPTPELPIQNADVVRFRLRAADNPARSPVPA